MAQFDESKIITALHPEKAEIGKKYWFSDDLLRLKHYVENGDNDERIGVLYRVETEEDLLDFPFYIKGDGNWRCLYPYEEEPSKRRMTTIQLMEWLAKGNGVYKNQCGYFVSTYFSLEIGLLDKEADESILIRPFGQTEWIEPTYEIYLKDCKSVTQEDIDDVAWRDGC